MLRNQHSMLCNQQNIIDKIKSLTRQRVNYHAEAERCIGKTSEVDVSMQLLATTNNGNTENLVDGIETVNVDHCNNNATNIDDAFGTEVLATVNRSPPKTNNVNSFLRRTPREPGFPDYLPKSIHEVFLQHQTYDLKSFKDCKKQEWPKKRKIAFSRRCFLHDKITDKARTFVDTADFNETKMARAASALDEERLSMKMSVDKYRQYLVAQKKDKGRS
jgi:hypothetical protein